MLYTFSAKNPVAVYVNIVKKNKKKVWIRASNGSSQTKTALTQFLPGKH